MKEFLIDEFSSFSWERLLEDLNGRTQHMQDLVYTGKNTYEFFANMVFSLLSHQDIRLMDDSIDALQNNIQSDIPYSQNKHSISSVGELLEKVRKSSSSITLFTSGTTGRPTAVSHRLDTLTRMTKVSERYANDIWGFCYNPSHMAGLQVFFQAFFNGNPIVFLFGLKRTEILENIERHQITRLSATPTFYRMLLPVDSDFPSVHSVTFGGEKADSTVMQKMTKLFPNARMRNIYASSEVGALLVSDGDLFQVPDFLKAFVRLDNNEILLHVSILGSFDAKRVIDNWYCTGDIVEIVDPIRKAFRFVSRKNEQINVGGNKVNPSEIEELLNQIEGVVASRVFGRSNSLTGNVLCAEIQTEFSGDVDFIRALETRIRCVLRDCVPGYKIPRIYRFVHQLAYSRAGKVLRK